MFINCGKFRGLNCCTGLTSGPISSRMNRLLGRHPGHLVVNKGANGEDPADRDLVLVHHRPVRWHSPIRRPSTRLRQLTTRRPAQGNISNKFYLENFEINLFVSQSELLKCSGRASGGASAKSGTWRLRCIHQATLWLAWPKWNWVEATITSHPDRGTIYRRPTLRSSWRCAITCPTISDCRPTYWATDCLNWSIARVRKPRRPAAADVPARPTASGTRVRAAAAARTLRTSHRWRRLNWLASCANPSAVAPATPSAAACASSAMAKLRPSQRKRKPGPSRTMTTRPTRTKAAAILSKEPSASIAIRPYPTSSSLYPTLMAITRRVSPEHFLIRFLFLHFHFRPSWSVIYFGWLENSANFKTSIDPFQIKRSSLSLSFLLRLLSSSMLQCFLVWRLDDVVRVCLSANHASLKARDYLQFQCTVHDWRQKQRFLSLSLFSISNNELDVIGFDSARPKKWCNQNPSCLFIPSVGPAAGLLYYPRSEAFSLSPTYLPSPPLINNFYFIICLLAPRCIDCTDLVRWIRVCNPFFFCLSPVCCAVFDVMSKSPVHNL